MNSSAIESRILVYEKSGNSLKPIKIYRDDQGRKWIESRPGTKFVIEVKNNDYNTYLAVVSVDGLNVINAEKAEMKPHNGYVLNSHQNIKINGWRTGLDAVREFVFTADKKQSYAHKLGAEEQNTGVIGLAFFKEKPKVTWCGYSSSSTTTWPPAWPTQYSWTSSAAPIYKDSVSSNDDFAYSVHNMNVSTNSATLRSHNVKSAPLVSNSFNMSTAQGKTVSDRVQEVEKEFEEAVSYADIIYYDSRKNLIANGILNEFEDKMPQPFSVDGFCPSL